jgi:gliding motility-associated-like protein
MKKSNYYLFIVFVLTISVSFAQRGKDGNITINTANRIVNEYTILTTNATAGSTSITVLASSLNANNRFSGNLAPGDLIMIIQMQGASILGQPDNSDPTVGSPENDTWGSILSYNNCGNYELCQVAAVPSVSSIVIDCGLLNDYTASGKVQVIRIPRYNTLTISAPGVLTCQAWNGTTGGVLAVEVRGATTINNGGKINVTGKGFRGGALFTTSGSRTQTTLHATTNTSISGNKGEGIAGFDTDYNPFGGKFGRGAAANAGGAGNVWTAGGGGSNAGLAPSWTGFGNPDTSQTGWLTAWNLESAGFAYTSSSGGGRGGYSFSASDENALVQGPNNTNWGGYSRGNMGGLGGRPLDYSSGRIFMGGGGGSGDQDNGQGGAGGAGGGIIYFNSYSTITGSGADSLLANGNPGGDSFSTPPLSSYSGKDAAGGGGGGGTILLNESNVSGLVLCAKGGNGGNQVLTAGSLYFGAMNEAEGPGGGGGGGYVALSAGAVTQQVDGGKSGTSNSDGMTEFLPNGATKGGAGLSNQSLSWIDTLSANNVTICSGDSTQLIATINGAVPSGLVWYDSATGGAIIGTDTLHTHALTDTTIYYAGVCPGIYRIPVVVNVSSSTASIAITASDTGAVCPNTPITFTATETNGGTSPTYQWFINSTLAGGNAPTYSSASFLNNDTVKCILTPNSTCSSGIPVVSNTIIVLIDPIQTASISILSSSDTICAGVSMNFIATAINGGTTPMYQWKLNGASVGTNTNLFNSSTISNGDIITCVLTSNANCVIGSPATSNAITITVNATPTPVFTSDISSGCHLPLCVQFTDVDSTGFNHVVYDFGDGDSAIIFSPQHCYTQAGNYSVSISVKDAHNCQGTTVNNNMVVISPEPTASYTYAPTTAITANTEVTFTNTSTNNNTSAWNFGEPSIGASNNSILSSPTHTYTDAGTYCVKLMVQNLTGCADSTEQCLTVTNEPSLVIPNIFTPNGDGKNDLFSLTTIAIKELQCGIYDRWGLKVAEWNKVDGTWDGRTLNGKNAPSGIYFYIIKATPSKGEELNKQGFLQLLRD